MTKKKFLNWIDEISAEATLDDIGFVGVPYASKKEIDRIIKSTETDVKEFMRKDKELRKKEMENYPAV